jgi:hypothetical protein
VPSGVGRNAAGGSLPCIRYDPQVAGFISLVLHVPVSADLAIHLKFLDSLKILGKVEQKRVLELVKQLATGYTGKGMRKHKVGPWTSYSANTDLRIIALETGNRTVLSHVNHHDAAYAWADRHVAVVEADTVVAIVPAGAEQATGSGTAKEERPRFSVSAEKLVGFGVPSALARILSEVTDQELLDVIGCLAPEFQENALAAVVGASEGESAGSAAPSDVVVIDDQESLEWALALPAESWRVFLHPRQRYVVDMPVDRHVLIRGGPGTGKTVAMAHRYLRLAQERQRRGGLPPVMLVLNDVTRQIVARQLGQLGLSAADIDIRLVSELPKNRKKLKQSLVEFGALVIDEGQDLPVDFVAALVEFMDDGEGLPPITLSYDANQALFHPTEMALSRLKANADLITLTFCYRNTREIITTASSLLKNLHTRYVGRGFQNRHHVEASRDRATADLTTLLNGPETATVLAADPADALSRTVEAVKELADRYGTVSALSVIVVEDAQGTLTRDLNTALASACPGVPVVAPAEVKGDEFLAGVVVDGLPHPPREGDAPEEVTIGRYKALSGLYVAATRFRDRLTIITTSPDSPAYLTH